MMKIDNLENKLTQLYVALAMSREVAQQSARADVKDEASKSMLSLLSVAAEMLEEILDDEFMEPRQYSDTIEIEMTM